MSRWRMWWGIWAGSLCVSQKLEAVLVLFPFFLLVDLPTHS
jgi:hypothetical protein